MTTIEDVIDETTGRSRAVLEYSRTMKTLVTRAKELDFTVESWAPLAELIDTENFVRIGPFKEVMNWAEYAEFLTNWARSSSLAESRRVSVISAAVKSCARTQPVANALPRLPTPRMETFGRSLTVTPEA